MFFIVWLAPSSQVLPFGKNNDSELRHTPLNIDFAGYNWIVRSGCGGPGPNYWSSSSENVWIDEQGYLHLKIRKVNDIWYCSEVYTPHYIQYGEYRFIVEGEIDNLDKNVVLGLFTYADDTHEIDIEFAKWNVEQACDNSFYTVQPYTTQGNSMGFHIELDTTLSTHLFNWQPNYIFFSSFQGVSVSHQKMIKSWIYRGNSIPSDSDHLRTHINFWLFEGNDPSDSSNLEVIIRDVQQPPPLGTKIDNQESNTTGKIILGQNCPNPFNNYTKIEYNLPFNSSVVFTVCNVKGQVIRKIELPFKSAGKNFIIWDGKDNSRYPVGSGLYLYTISNQSEIQTKKLLLLR
jgi:hypothetical protein